MTIHEGGEAERDLDDVPSVGQEAVSRNRWVIVGSALIVVAIAVAAVVLASRSHPGDHASGTAAHGRVADQPSDATSMTSADAAAAVQAWAEFPVAANPRPLVLLGEDSDGPDGGFTSGDAKMAFLSGQVRLAVPAPAAPHISGGYPVISAQDALQTLASNDASKPGTPLVLDVTEAQFATHPFATDRGVQTLPAWRFRVAQSSGDVYVLAVAPSARYFSPRVTLGYPSERASLSADGRDITIRYVARYDSTDPCDPPYTSSLDVVQARTAVAIVVTTHDLPIPTFTDSMIGCAGVGRADNGPVTSGAPNTRTIQLDAPLGARVVVNGSGQPYQVTQS